jgi:hypothetical protein
MLHIVNGDIVGNKLREGTLAGEVLVWRELYTEGPLYTWPEQYPQQDIRADFMMRAYGIPRELWIDSSKSQQQQLAKFEEHEEIILWFEHDLFDQTMLSYLLHWFSYRSLGDTIISLVSIGEFPGIKPFLGLGQLSSEQLSSLFGDRVQLGHLELDLGSRAWEAYASTDPRHLYKFLQSDTSGMPFFKSAYTTHLTRFPSTVNGLGIVEQTTIELLLQGHNTPLQLFEHLSPQLHELGMGDIQYWYILRKMTQGLHPLLQFEGHVTYPKYQQSINVFLSTPIQLTELGRQIQSEPTDWVALNGIEAWLGGVHLQGYTNIWRWNSATANLEIY